MTTIKIAAATMLAAAGAVVAGALGAAAPANAQADKFVAISYSPETGSYGWGNNYDSLDGARIRSLSECQNFGGNHCVFLAWSRNGCAALAVNGDNYYGWYGATRWEAEQQALSRNGGGYILVSQCAT
jgi:Domain of unknown function (DUF4189)